MQIENIYWPAFFSAVFTAIVFLQSGLNKLLNYKRELGWIRQKFVKSGLYNYVGILFLVLTFFELFSGFLSLSGMFRMLVSGESDVAWWGSWLSCLTMTMLVFGQRITKDYSGAATLIPYFIACLLGLYFLTPH